MGNLFFIAPNGMGICAVRPSKILNESTALTWRIAYIPCYAQFLITNMKTEDIIKHLKLQDSNLDFYKREVKRLEQQISDIKSISNVVNTVDLGLNKKEYLKSEIIDAYNKMLKYEGIKEDRVGGLIIDTFIEFLNGSHHSLNGA